MEKEQEEKLKKYVGNRIKEERKKKKLTQQQLGDLIGVKHNTISSYENATNAPEQDSLFKIAKALGISVDDLFPPTEASVQNNLERALRMSKDLNLKEIDVMRTMIEKALSLDEKEREKFLESLKFAMEFYDRSNQ